MDGQQKTIQENTEKRSDQLDHSRSASNFRFEIKTLLIFTCLIAAGLGLKRGHWATFVLSTTTFFTVFIFSEDIWPDQLKSDEFKEGDE